MINPNCGLYLEQVREFIFREMSSGKDSYISEAGLAGRLGISRSAARKALLTLEGEGCVQSTTKGYQRIDYSQTSYRVGIVMRRMLDHQAAALAATEATARELFELAAIFAEMEEAYKGCDKDKYAELDLEFHRCIVDASHDILLKRMMSMVIWTLRIRDAAPWSTEAYAATHDSHRKILESLRARDAVQASFFAYTHLASGEYGAEKPGEKVPLPLPDSVLMAKGLPVQPDGLEYYGQPVEFSRRKE